MNKYDRLWLNHRKDNYNELNTQTQSGSAEYGEA